jgi:hypothetical protein
LNTSFGTNFSLAFSYQPSPFSLLFDSGLAPYEGPGYPLQSFSAAHKKDFRFYP